MKTEDGIVDGDVLVTEEYDLQGLIIGNVTALHGSVLSLHGMCKKNLFVEEGAKVFLYGMVCGSAYNNGGYLEVHGMIMGKLFEESGETIVKRK